MSPHQLDFSARIARIESGSGSSKSTLYVGMDETYAVTYGQRGQNRAGQSSGGVFRSLGSLMLLITAFVVGVAANVAARLVDFIYNGLPGPATNVDMQMGIDFAIALVVSLLLGLVLGIRLREFIMVRVIGIAAGMLALHNLVHFYPQYFAPAFPAPWVNHILSSTEAGTIIWRGVSIVI
jgi:hypothetical protein